MKKSWKCSGTFLLKKWETSKVPTFLQYTVVTLYIAVLPQSLPCFSQSDFYYDLKVTASHSACCLPTHCGPSGPVPVPTACSKVRVSPNTSAPPVQNNQWYLQAGNSKPHCCPVTRKVGEACRHGHMLLGGSHSPGVGGKYTADLEVHLSVPQLDSDSSSVEWDH